MPDRIADFASHFIANPSARKELDVPVLLWEAPAIIPGTGQTLDLTQQSGPPTRSGAGGRSRPSRGDEALVLPLRKGDSRTNAFVMGVTVGRTDNNDLVLNDPSVSRFHAYFLRDSRKNTWRLVDADSKNGTWVGAMKLAPNATAELQDSVRIRFGDVEMTFLLPESFFRHVSHLIAGGAG